MKKLPRFLVVAALVLGVTAVPGSASADVVENRCEALEKELAKYGWHTPICVHVPPETP